MFFRARFLVGVGVPKWESDWWHCVVSGGNWRDKTGRLPTRKHLRLDGRGQFFRDRQNNKVFFQKSLFSPSPSSSTHYFLVLRTTVLCVAAVISCLLCLILPIFSTGSEPQLNLQCYTLHVRNQTTATIYAMLRAKN